MNSSAEAASWAINNVRHFRRLLGVITALFLVSEVVALLGVVPHLRPVSPREISANILFAIGFGAPLVLYLSDLPRLREMAATLAAGLVLALGLWQVQLWLGLPPALKRAEVAA